MSRSLTSPLLGYLIAGARLTGCKVSMRLGNDGRMVDTPDDKLYLTSGGGVPGWPGDQSAGLYTPNPGGYWCPVTNDDGTHVTLGDLLDRWQPDRVSSVSRQHYIETGLYLPVGPAEREALGVEDDDDRSCVRCGDHATYLSSRGWCDGCETPDSDALDRIRDIATNLDEAGGFIAANEAVLAILADTGR
jgi:hypothetical protein